MNRIPFKLEENEERTVPNDGEMTGRFMAEAAMLLYAKYEHKKYVGPYAAMMLQMAAKAYDIGACRSIGHSRTDRYQAEGARILKLVDSVYSGEYVVGETS